MTSLISADSDPLLAPSSTRSQLDTREPKAGAAIHPLLDSLFEAALLCGNGKVIHANPAACTLFGMPLASLAGKNLADCLLFKDKAGKEASGASRAVEHPGLPATLIRQGGHAVEVLLRAALFTSPGAGQTPQEQIFFLCGHKERGPDLAPWPLMEKLPWPMMRLDAGLNYLQGNAALRRTLAAFVRLSEGMPLSAQGWPAAFCRELEAAVVSINLHSGTPRLRLEWQKNQRRHRYIAELIPEQDAHGTLHALLVAIQEEAPRKEEESSRLRHAREAHEHVLAASHARDAFFGWVSHELRTPLNGIQSWAHILETCVGSASDSPLVARALNGIRTGIGQQLRLIEELVDVSRVIQGKLPLTRHTFALAPVAQSAAESLFASALSRRITLASRYAAEEIFIESDPCRMQQALHLLLSHALETSPPYGMVSFSVLRRRRNAAIRIVHGCEESSGHEYPATGSSAASHKDSRKLMNLLLARCLVEWLGGSMTTCFSSKADKTSHTLLLPLAKDT